MTVIKVVLLYTLLGPTGFHAGSVDTNSVQECRTAERELRALNEPVGLRVIARCVVLEWPPK